MNHWTCIHEVWLILIIQQFFVPHVQLVLFLLWFILILNIIKILRDAVFDVYWFHQVSSFRFELYDVKVKNVVCLLENEVLTIAWHLYRNTILTYYVRKVNRFQEDSFFWVNLVKVKAKIDSEYNEQVISSLFFPYLLFGFFHYDSVKVFLSLINFIEVNSSLMQVR